MYVAAACDAFESDVYTETWQTTKTPKDQPGVELTA